MGLISYWQAALLPDLGLWHYLCGHGDACSCRAGRAAGASAGPASGQGLSAAAAVARAAERLRGRSAAAAHESME